MSRPEWWQEMAQAAVAAGHETFSVDWYRSMRDQYRARFPDADARSLENMDSFVVWAEQR